MSSQEPVSSHTPQLITKKVRYVSKKGKGSKQYTYRYYQIPEEQATPELLKEKVQPSTVNRRLGNR